MIQKMNIYTDEKDLIEWECLMMWEKGDNSLRKVTVKVTKQGI